MKEYLTLNHMQLADETVKNNNHYFHYYHFIIKETRTTSRLCVIFDASYKTTAGISFNDILFWGSKIQNDIFNVTLQFHNISYFHATSNKCVVEVDWDDVCLRIL